MITDTFPRIEPAVSAGRRSTRLWRVVVVKNGRRGVPRPVRAGFWDGVRAGLGVREGALAAGAGASGGEGVGGCGVRVTGGGGRGPGSGGSGGVALAEGGLDPVDDVVGGSARREDLGHAHPLQFGDVGVGDDAAA